MRPDFSQKVFKGFNWRVTHIVSGETPLLCCLKKNLNASIDLLSIPQSGGKISDR